MRKKLPELRVERILLAGRVCGGEIFLVGRAAQVGGRRAESGGDDAQLLVVRLGFAGLPVLADRRRAAETARDRRFGDAGLADECVKSVINKQNNHLAFV